MEKTFMDPVHGPIEISDEIVLLLIETPAVQRLRRIRQLGGAFGTYHGAEHSRFGHALGSLHVMRRILDRLRHLGCTVPAELRRAALAAALLHDVGHGPFSHALEGTLTPGVSHEEWTRRVLVERGSGAGIPEVLEGVERGLSERVWRLLSGRAGEHPWVAELLTGQLDVDRMDYLLRDALYTGTAYGRFDLERIVGTLQLHEGRIVLQHKGIHAAEQYVFARYFMYWQVYFHKTSRAQELVLRGAWRRAARLFAGGGLAPGQVPRALQPLLAGGAGTAEYLACDDYDVVSALKGWCAHPDAVLSDLSRRFLERKLLKPVTGITPDALRSDRLEEARAAVTRRGWDPEYYFLVDRTSDVAYDYYLEGGGAGPREAILILDPSGRTREISELSDAIGAIARQRREAVNVYVPAACREEVAAILFR